MTKLIRKAQYGMFWNPPSSWGLDLDDSSDLNDNSVSAPIRGTFQYTNIADLFNRLKGSPIDLSSMAIDPNAAASYGASTGLSTQNSNTQSQVEPQNTSNNISSGGSTPLPSGGTGISGKKLAEGKYPYANTTPYKGIKTYDLRKITTRPIIDYDQYEQLLKDKSTNYRTFDLVPNNAKTFINKKTAGGRNNNPCNISNPKDSIGYIGVDKMGDGQKAAVFDSVEHGLASAMRLYRRVYGKRNVAQMDDGMRGHYDRNEPLGLTALRIHGVTKKCKQLGISPTDKLNTDDKWTLCSFVALMAKHETGSTLSRELLDRVYKIAFG